MPTFDMVVVGCGGGPSETNLSSYLLKPSDQTWEDGIIGLEAGSGFGTLQRVMSDNTNLFRSEGNLPRPTPAQIYSFIRCFLISHSHLDHVNGLVLSAGAHCGPRKRVFGASATLKDMELIFSDRIWPNLASWKESDPSFMLLYSALVMGKYQNVAPNVSVRAMPISHGKNASGPYESTAFFIKHDLSGVEMLFWGDVEADQVAARPLNVRVWREAAPRIVSRALRTIFIECSWPSGRPTETLFGHLTPEHLVGELGVLAVEVVAARTASTTEAVTTRKTRSGSILITSLARKRRRTNPAPDPESLRGALEGVQVYIMHCKDDIAGKHPEAPIQHVIAGQVRALVEQAGLGCDVHAVEQGSHITI